MEPKNPDAELVALLTQHQTPLRLYIASLIPGDPAVDDVCQETNTIIWEKRSDFELGTNFKAWIFSIARFQVRKFRYRESRNARLVFCEELEDIISEEFPAHLEDISRHHQALQQCMQQLKPSDRQLLHHRYFESSKLESYGDRVGRSVGVLKVTLHRIRNRLLQCIEKKVRLEKELQA